VRGDIPKLGILVPGLVGDFLERRFENTHHINALNTLDSYKDRGKNLMPYLDSNKRIGVGGDVWVDSDNKESLYQELQTLIDKGHVQEGIYKIQRCSTDCLRVEILDGIEIKSDKNHLISTVENKKCCTVCNHELVVEEKSALVIKFPDTVHPFNVFPSEFQKDINETARKLSGMSMLISRQRDTGIVFQTGQKTYNIDVDFFWLNYLNTISKGVNKIMLIGSNHVRNHLMYITALSNMTNDNENTPKEIKVIMPSYIKAVAGFEEIPSKEYLKEDPNTTRLLVYSSLSWNKDAQWATEFLKYIKKRSVNVSWNNNIKVETEEMHDVVQSCELINRANIQKALKDGGAKNMNGDDYDIRGMII
jgi:hypothetical protein